MAKWLSKSQVFFVSSYSNLRMRTPFPRLISAQSRSDMQVLLTSSSTNQNSLHERYARILKILHPLQLTIPANRWCKIPSVDSRLVVVHLSWFSTSSSHQRRYGKTTEEPIHVYLGAIASALKHVSPLRFQRCALRVWSKARGGISLSDLGVEGTWKGISTLLDLRNELLRERAESSFLDQSYNKAAQWMFCCSDMSSSSSNLGHNARKTCCRARFIARGDRTSWPVS